MDSKKDELAELERQIIAPGFWDDASRAKKIQKDRGRIQETIESWESFSTTWEDASLLFEMALDEEDVEAEQEVSEILEKLEWLRGDSLHGRHPPTTIGTYRSILQGFVQRRVVDLCFQPRDEG